jgi:hypothetical protein
MVTIQVLFGLRWQLIKLGSDLPVQNGSNAHHHPPEGKAASDAPPLPGRVNDVVG